MGLQELFKKASKDVHDLESKPSTDILLKLYALFKQATEGDVKGEKPSGFDLKAAAKYKAWENLKGMDSGQAMQEYIDLVNELLKK